MLGLSENFVSSYLHNSKLQNKLSKPMKEKYVLIEYFGWRHPNHLNTQFNGIYNLVLKTLHI